MTQPIGSTTNATFGATQEQHETGHWPEHCAACGYGQNGTLPPQEQHLEKEVIKEFLKPPQEPKESWEERLFRLSQSCHLPYAVDEVPEDAWVNGWFEAMGSVQPFIRSEIENAERRGRRRLAEYMKTVYDETATTMKGLKSLLQILDDVLDDDTPKFTRKEIG